MVRFYTLLAASFAATAAGLMKNTGLRIGLTSGNTVDMYIGSTMQRMAIMKSLATASETLLDMDLTPSSPASGKAAKDATVHLGKISEKQKDLLTKQHEALKDLLTHLKSSISNINKAEASGKEENKREIEKMTKRLASEREELKQKDLTDFRRALLVNRTKTDEKELEYWSRNRELQHGMFHTNLKMTHGLMSKANAVIEAYNMVMSSGKLNAGMLKQLKEVSASLPHVSESSVEQKPADKPLAEKPVDKKLAEKTPATPKAVQLKAAEQKPVEQKPVEKKSGVLSAAEKKPVQQKSAEKKPVEKAAQQKPAEQKLVAAAKPTEKKPVELKTPPQKPVEQKPVQQTK